MRHALQVHPDGEVGQALDALQPGDKIAIKGPFGKYVYKPGKFKAIGAPLINPTPYKDCNKGPSASTCTRPASLRPSVRPC